LIPGYGLGHFIVGDNDGGKKFLILGLTTTLVWAVGPSFVAVVEGNAPDMTSRTGFWVFLGGILAWTGVKVWETFSAGAYAEAHRRRIAGDPPIRLGFGPDGATVDVPIFKF